MVIKKYIDEIQLAECMYERVYMDSHYRTVYMDRRGQSWTVRQASTVLLLF